MKPRSRRRRALRRSFGPGLPVSGPSPTGRASATSSRSGCGTCSTIPRPPRDGGRTSWIPGRAEPASRPIRAARRWTTARDRRLIGVIDLPRRLVAEYDSFKLAGSLSVPCHSGSTSPQAQSGQRNQKRRMSPHRSPSRARPSRASCSVHRLRWHLPRKRGQVVKSSGRNNVPNLMTPSWRHCR